MGTLTSSGSLRTCSTTTRRTGATTYATVPTSSAHSTLTSSGSLRTCSTPTRRTGATTYATVPTSIGPCLGSGNLRTSPFLSFPEIALLLLQQTSTTLLCARWAEQGSG